MDCKECSSDMTALLDGELPLSRADQVRSHIDACFPCTEELAALREAADLVHAHHRKLEPHPAAWNTVRNRLDRVGAASPYGWLALPFTRWQTAMAIALTGFGLTIGLWSYQRHIESRRLEHYMTQYVQMRKAQEPPDGQRATDPENPFLRVHQTTQGNPFRR